MTAEEFEQTIDTLGLSQLEAGRMLGIDGHTVRRYVLAERSIPEPTARLLRLLVKRPELVSMVYEMASSDFRAEA